MENILKSNTKILKQMKNKLKIAFNILSKKNKNILKRKMKYITIQMNMILINYVSQKCIINY